MPEIGIIVSAENKASAVFGAVGKATVVMNQALEIGKKSFETFRFLILDNITAMVEYRGETDKISKQFRDMADDAQFLRATLANVLTPIFLGLRDAINETGNQFIELVNANKQLIATNITTWLADIARIAVDGVATGILFISKAYSGWIELIGIVQFAFEKQFELILTGISKVLEHFAWLASALDDDLAASLRGVAESAKKMSDNFAESSDASLTKVNEQIVKQREFEETLKRFKTVAIDFVGEAEIAMLDRIAKGWSNVQKHVNDVTVEIKKTGEVLKEEAIDWQDVHKSVAISIGQNMGNAFSQVAAGAEDAGKIMSSAVVDSAQTAITSYALSSQAAAMFSQAGIPIAGPFLAITAGTLIFGLIKALMSDLPKAALGGVISSGTSGRDDVGVLVQRGEGVLRTGQTAAIMRLADSLEQTGGGRGSVNINFAPRIDALDLPTPERRKKMLLSLATDLESLVDDGLLRLRA